MTKILNKLVNIETSNYSANFQRNEKTGIVSIKCADQLSFSFAQGYLHANDRITQLMLVRLIAQGRLSECLMDNDETFAIDKFMRNLCLYHEAKEEVSKLSKKDLEFAQAYADGVNYFLENNRRPFEFILTRFRPKKWEVADTLVTIKIMSYVGLAQTQQDLEKLIIELIKNDCDLEKIKDLFYPHLDNLTDKQVHLLKKVKINDLFVPSEIKTLSALPKIVASNNWVLSPKKSKTNSVLQCNDPHLECNRLPAIWYEYQADVGEQSYMGVTMPGLPGLIMGRNKDISYGFTYGFMDMIDFFIEEVKENKVREDHDFVPFIKRKETIHRKKHHEAELIIRETKNGVLECESEDEILTDGFYLSRAWSCHKDGAAKSLKAMREILDCQSSEDFLDIASQVTISCNWLVGDTNGHIGYQQSGKFPKRFDSGLFPLEGWQEDKGWQGIHEASYLNRIVNPDSGFIATANNDMNKKDFPTSINMAMGSYRVDRINSILSSKEKFSIEDMKSLQTDLYSIQAEKLMKLISPVLQNSMLFSQLENWDYRYSKESREAFVFEKLYSNLLESIFTYDFLSKDLFNYLMNKTNILVDYYDVFDKVIFEEKSLWFQKKSLNEFIIEAIKKTEEYFSNNEIKTWGERQECSMNNIFFDGKLPKFLGFDHGPIQLEGNRATVVQGALFEAHDRVSTFCPSYRFITSMDEFKAYTILAGGVSDRRFGKYYLSDVSKWLNFDYKELI